MVLDMAERRNNTDEPELDAWETLAAVNTRILKNIFPKALSGAAGTASLSSPNEKQNEDRTDDRQSGDDEKQRGEQHREYVDQRLRDLAEFERRASGKRS
jgi:hypothetical protein